MNYPFSSLPTAHLTVITLRCHKLDTNCFKVDTTCRCGTRSFLRRCTNGSCSAEISRLDSRKFRPFGTATFRQFRLGLFFGWYQFCPCYTWVFAHAEIPWMSCSKTPWMPMAHGCVRCEAIVKVLGVRDSSFLDCSC